MAIVVFMWLSYSLLVHAVWRCDILMSQHFDNSCCVSSCDVSNEREGHLTFDTGHEKTLALGFWTRSDTNQAVQPQKMARSLKFKI